MDVLALGEILIDFTVTGPPAVEWRTIRGSAGGAPANVLAAVSRLGGTTAFIGKVGGDPFGDFLVASLEDVGIDTTCVMRDGAETTLAFVTLREGGERDFSFQRNPGADTQLRAQDIDARWFEDAKIFHFGSLSLTDEPAREATWEAVRRARQVGCVISFDPNLRPPLWKDLHDAKAMILAGIQQSDIVKMADNELTFLTGEEDIRLGLTHIRHINERALYLVTRGARGTVCCMQSQIRDVAPVKVDAMDTTAAGDAFLGTFLYALTHMAGENDIRRTLRDIEAVQPLVALANVGGALTTTKAGAFSALPTLDEIKHFL